MVISPELKSAILAGFPIHLGSHYSYSSAYYKARDAALKDFRELHPEISELKAQHDDLRERLGEVAKRLSTEYGLDFNGHIDNEKIFVAKGGAVLYAAPRLCASQVFDLVARMEEPAALEFLAALGLKWSAPKGPAPIDG